MNSQSIEAVFGDYLKTEQTQFAILINGNWGCGKTYFWKNRLSTIAENEGFKTIYISLNGLGKIETLESNLFYRMIPYIGKKENSTLKNIFQVSSNLMSQAGKFFFKTGLYELLQGVSIESFNFSKYVICFDDLERCQFSVKEVLGFINNLVEHKFLKTIILTDENNIDVAQKGYSGIKEKVIGRVFNFDLDLREALPYLIEKYRDSDIEYYQFANTHTETIIQLFKTYKVNNLRVVNFYLEILRKVHPSLKNIENQYTKEVLFFSALICIEFKTGNLTSSDFNDPKGIDLIHKHYQSLNLARTMREKDLKDEPTPKQYAESFYESYLAESVEEYYFYKSIYNFILSGHLSPNELDNEIKNRYPEKLTPEIEGFRKLLQYKYRELEDDEFETLSKEVLEFARQGAYNIYDYVQLAKFYYHFSDQKLIEESVASIDLIMNEGLNLSKQRKEINDYVLTSLLHFADEDQRITKWKLIVKQVHGEIKKDEYALNGRELIDALKTSNEMNLASVFKKYTLSKEFLIYIDSDSLFHSVTTTSNKQLFNFTELLLDRYNSTNIGEFLYDDKKVLENLKNRITVYLDQAPDIKPLRKNLISTLETKLIQINDKLETSRMK